VLEKFGDRGLLVGPTAQDRGASDRWLSHSDSVTYE
jgi:hypothetical protein